MRHLGVFRPVGAARTRNERTAGLSKDNCHPLPSTEGHLEVSGNSDSHQLDELM